MADFTKSESIIKVVDAQSVKEAIEINESNLDDLISHVNSMLIPSGTSMLFNQASAPTGWTKKTNWANDASLVVGNTYASGGTDSPTSWETDVSVDNHDSHNHQWYEYRSSLQDQSYTSGGIAQTITTEVNDDNGVRCDSVNSSETIGIDLYTDNSSLSAHSVNQDTYEPLYVTVIAATKD